MIKKDMSNEDYHGDRTSLSSSDLKLILQDSYQFYMKKYEGVKIEFGNKLALDLGSYIHSLLLEEHNTDKEFIVFDGRRAGKKYTEFKEENPGKIIINDTSAFMAQEIVRIVKNNDQAGPLFKNGSSEVSLFIELEGIPIKVRADYLQENAVVDLKTTSSEVDMASFSQTMEKYMYSLSAALYVDAFSLHLKKPMDFYFVVAQKNPINIATYKCSLATLEKGRILYKKAIEIFKECQRTGNWKKPLIQEI